MLRFSRIQGVSACVPRHAVTIDSLKFDEDKARKDFIRHVGVREKRTSYNALTSSDLCLEAAKTLLASLEWEADSIGVLIFVTQSADHLMPSTAISLQHRLNLPNSCLAFDINLGCSGWVYGLSVISALMQVHGIQRGLLLAGETDVLTSKQDMSYFPLMGDAGTATALEFSPTALPMKFQFYSDGSRFKAIHAPNSGARHFAKGGGEEGLRFRAQMDADQILGFCIRDVIPDLRKFMDWHSVEAADVDYFVFHQANKLINETMRKKLGIPKEKVPYSIEKFGNTSSASIPLTFVTSLGEQLMRKHTLICSGFGVGLSMAHVLIRQGQIMCLPLIEVEVPGK